MTQADINSIVVFILLAIILFYVGNFKQKLQTIYKKSPLLPTQQFLNTQARIKSIEFSPNAIITIDIDGIIVSWNGGAHTLFGYTEEEIIGKSLVMIIPERFRTRHIEGIKRLKNGGQSSLLGKTTEMTAINRNKVEFPIELALWKWMEGSNTFYTGIIQDISEAKKHDIEIEEILNVYKRGEAVDRTGTWSWDVINDKMFTTEGFNSIFDIDVTTKIDSGYILRRIYHEDLPRVEEAIRLAFEKNEGYSIQYRIVTSNGTLMNVEVKAETYLNNKGELINITGTIHIL